MLLAVQVRVLLLAEVPGGGVEERPQGHMQADPADAEIVYIKYQFQPDQRPLKPQKATHMQEQIWRMRNTNTLKIYII